MRHILRFSMALTIGLLTLGIGAAAPLDLAGPVVTWNAPGEGSCWQIDAAHPSLGLVVSAEDPSGVKQGTLWMKAGHQAWTSDFSTWSRVWGHTYAHDGSAPASVRETLAVLMTGRAEGEYTFIVEFADMARHNLGYQRLHVSVDFAPPTLAITSPAAGSSICRDRTLRIDVDAGDTGCGVNAVQLYLGAVTSTTPVTADSTSPYQLSVPPALLHVDSLRIIVQAIDRAGRLSQAEVTVRPNRICLARGTR